MKILYFINNLINLFFHLFNVQIIKFIFFINFNRANFLFF